MILSAPLSERYYRRLHIDPITLDIEPTLKKLQVLVEAHITHIPFENIAQHGGYGDEQYDQRTVTDLDTVVNKVLDRHRGGFCIELNALFCYWLETELNYPIQLVPGHVARDELDDATNEIPSTTTTTTTTTTTLNKRKVFTGPATHMVPFCQTIDDNFNQQYMIDVAFGEPSIQPLRYPDFNIIQTTPDGMQSQFIRCSTQQYNYNNNIHSKYDDDSDDTHDYVMLLWYINGEWVPRLRWNYCDSIIMTTTKNNIATTESSSSSSSSSSTTTTTTTELKKKKSILEQLSEFQCMYDLVNNPASPFYQKLIITKLSRTHKFTFAGTKYKITGPPRFPSNSQRSNNNNIDEPTPIVNKEVDATIQVVGQQLQQQQQQQQQVVPVTIRYLDNDDEIRLLLLEVFGIPIRETSTMKFTTGKSSTANKAIWDFL